MNAWTKRLFYSAVLLAAGFLTAFWTYGGSILIKSAFLARSHAVSIQNGETLLAGKLWLPRGAERPPAVVLVHGSGPATAADMDWYARKFCLQGYAALAYDKRGAGNSSGEEKDWRYFSFDSLASDALAAVAFLKAQQNIDGKRIGVFGVSQGGWVAPIVASKAGPDVSFMILLSASVSTVAQDRLFERAARLQREGFAESELQDVRTMQLADHAFSRDTSQYAVFNALWSTHKNKRWFRRVYLSDEPIGSEHPWRVWSGTVLDFDPVPLISALDIPVVYVFGDPALDRLGPVDLSLANVRKLASGMRPYKLLQYDGYDHNLYQEALFGMAPNHAAWEEEAMPWINQQLRR